VELGDFQTALNHLQDLQQRQGRHIAALRLELKARQYLGDAEGVLKLARQLEKRGGLQPEPAHAIRQRAYQEALARRQGDAAQLLEYFNSLRREERDPRLTLSVAGNLHQLGEDDAAAHLVEAALSESEWSTELATLYGQLDCAEGAGKTLTARIAKAEYWLRQRPEDSRLLLALGRMCERQKLWGKARNYLEASLALKPSREGYLTLARLLDGLGETETANRHFRRAAEMDET
jgi:HemY protein